MNTTSNQSISTTYCPSSSSSPPSWDVFLSFHGKDIRRNFISHLYLALDQAGITTFRDEPALEKGQIISSGLHNAIEDSKMFVVVLSENYARSSWCLDELVHILSSNTTDNQVVPVFYYVDPSDLRHMKGTFGEALQNHKNRYSLDVIDKWKSALAKIAELSGYHLKIDTNENESDIVQEIVEHVASHASAKLLPLEEYLFGIDCVVEEIYQKLQMQSNDVRALGICGMGGIGKTTIAKVFYNKYSNMFDIGCFIENVKQYSQGGSPMLHLLQKLLSDLLRKKNYKVSDVKGGIRQLQYILYSKKNLIVLDDVDQSNQLGWVARLCKMSSSGSRIVITTRNVNLLNQLKVDISGVDIYMVKKLEQKDSLKLFSYHVFRKPLPPLKFRELSESFVTYAAGLPLALKVVSSYLCGRNEISFWKAQHKKIREIPQNEILKILRLSYDELADETEKVIFLDIVFFFVGKDKDEAVHIFRSCDFYPDVGIPILVDRCLLEIDHNNKFQMHDLIQDMGREVMREQSQHGNRKHLYLCEDDESQAMQNLEGIDKVQSLVLDLSKLKRKHTNITIFERLPNLRLLEVIGAHDIRGNFENSFHELRCIRWYHCPWTCLPLSFRPKKLVSLDMPFNEFKTLWKSSKLIQRIKQPLMSLTSLNMGYSYKLKKTPDFRNLKMIEKLCFSGCHSLLEIHSSIGQLCSLSDLDLSDCKKLKELPETIRGLTKLGHFDLSGCVNLKRLPEKLGDMKGLKMLDASHTAIEQLPDSIVHLKELVRLDLTACQKLRKLPEQFGIMKGLEKLDASESGIEELPDSIGWLINLADLFLSSCRNLTSLPDSICKLKLLKELNLTSCSKLERLPEQLGMMHSLEELYAYGTSIQELPDSIGRLGRLKYMNFMSCKKLKHVPNSIWNLESLIELSLPQQDIFRSNYFPDMVKNMKKLETLRLRCNIRLWLSMILSFSSLRTLHLSDDGNSLSPSTKWFSLSKLSNLKDLTLVNWWGSSFPELPLHLTKLTLYNHATLEQLPDLSYLEHLQRLDIVNCISLQSLPPPPLNLKSLSVAKCTSLKDVPDLSMLRELEYLQFVKCSNLKSVDLKESHLQVRAPNYLFSADLPNSEIAKWFDYESIKSTISFKIPSPVMADDFLGIALWVVSKYKSPKASGYIRAVITNQTDGLKKNYNIHVSTPLLGEEVQSKVECISIHKFSMRSGDRIKVSFQVIGGEELKVEKCGAHVILKTLSTP